jgi:hypothetical protein
VPPTRDGKDQRHIGWIDLLVTRDTDHPAQAACAKRMPERRARAIAGIDEHAFEPHAGGLDLVDLLDGNLRLLPRLRGILLPKVHLECLPQCQMSGGRYFQSPRSVDAAD